MIGLDIGFGDVKYVTQEKLSKYPSAIAYAPQGGVFLGSHADSAKAYSYNSKNFIVGEQAIYDALPTRDINFLIEYAPVFIAHTRGMVSFNTLCVGLPLGYYSKAAEFKRTLSNFIVDGIEHNYEVNVLPQGLGVLFDYIFDDQGRKINNVSDCLVVDVGFNTVDILAYVSKKAVSAQSGMLEGQGICAITNEISKYINQKYKDTITDQETKEVLRSRAYKRYGQIDDLSAFITEITQQYAHRLLSHITQRWDSLLKRSEKILIAGGGAYYLNGHIPSQYKNMVEIVRPNGSEYANAAGFYKYLRMNYAKAERFG
jgi:plasmid segregation protein ParM